MPAHMRRRGGTYIVCADWQSGAFPVSDLTVREWERLTNTGANPSPVNWAGHRLRPYPSFDVEAHAPYAPSGVYVDHGDRAVQLGAYELRDRLGDDRQALRTIAERMGFRHWRDAYNAVRNEGRRRTGESGRDGNGDLRWRAWNAYRPSRQAIAATAPVRTAGGLSYDTRPFGIEVETNGALDRPAIAAAFRQATGLSFHERWTQWHRDPHVPGWQGTRDGTVAAEIISDILPGDDASLAEVSAILAATKAHGGVAGPEQGMHVHHDLRDFTVADKVRLVDNLAAIGNLVLAFVPQGRFTTSWCKRVTPAQYASVRSQVAAGSVGHDRYWAFNFNHLFSSSPRIEFRALGHTLHAGKIRAWVRVGQAIMAATKAGVVFTDGTTEAQMLATLREHGLSEWAAERFARVTAARRMGRRDLAA